MDEGILEYIDKHGPYASDNHKARVVMMKFQVPMSIAKEMIGIKEEDYGGAEFRAIWRGENVKKKE